MIARCGAAAAKMYCVNDYANRGKIKASPEESERETSEISTSGGNRGAKMRRVCFSSTDKARFIHRGLLSPSAIAWLRSCILSRVLQILILSVSFLLMNFALPVIFFRLPIFVLSFFPLNIQDSRSPVRGSFSGKNPECTFNLSLLDLNLLVNLFCQSFIPYLAM